MLNSNVSIISVSQLNTYIKNVLDENEILNNLLVKGEVSNLKYHPSGHLYFSIKDVDSVIKCVMFNSYTKNLNFKLSDGDKVIVNASLSVYVQVGTYQLYVKGIEKDGIGNLYLEFEKMKKKLEEQGLFSSYHKKKIPSYPFKIGIVTSSSGAALRDIVSIIKRRWPVAQLLVFSCLVQGDEASKSIISALENAKKFNLDVVIVGRGGGSIEDLWCFNDQELAYYLYDYEIPLISAVGHETDYTICDFVCDMRAATPSAAAELVTPDINTVYNNLNNFKHDLYKYIKNIAINNNRLLVSNLGIYFSKENLEKILVNKKNEIQNYLLFFNNKAVSLYKDSKYLISENVNDLKVSFKDILSNNKKEVYTLVSALDNLSPSKVLLRGYSVVKTSEKNVKSINDVEVGDVVQVRVSDGKFYSNVVKKEEK